MLQGELYIHVDSELLVDRRKCKEALVRFNRADELGLAPHDHMKLFTDIVDPRGVENIKGHPRGSIGQQAIVEAPFRCEYGYNTTIGENTIIHSGCTIVDACRVYIGANCFIGPNVTILSSMAHVSMNQRKGIGSRYQGKETIIESDCYIGAGAVIYPGVTLDRGAYVGPGQTVSSDIVVYGWVGYKPGYMH